MSPLTLPYRILPGTGRLLPLCDVTLLGPTGSSTVVCAVDSGAEWPIFELAAAEDASFTGLDFNDTIQFGGNRVSAVTRAVWLRLGDEQFKARVSFVERIALGYSLLGRRDVFDRFGEVAFVEQGDSPRVEFRA